jgi:hypothetical protein
VKRTGFAEADPSEEDDIGLIIEELQAEEVLDVYAVDVFRPVPEELIQGFDDGETGKPDATAYGAVSAQAGFSFDKHGKVVNMRPVLFGRLIGQGLVIGAHEKQVEQF